MLSAGFLAGDEGEGFGGGGKEGLSGEVGLPGGLGVGAGERDDEEGFEEGSEAEVDAVDGVGEDADDDEGSVFGDGEE